MATKRRPPNRRGGNKPSVRGPVTPKPQPQPVKAKGTRHTGRSSGGSVKPPSKCCPMVAAVRAAGRGRFRLARRYAAFSVRIMVGRLA